MRMRLILLGLVVCLAACNAQQTTRQPLTYPSYPPGDDATAAKPSTPAAPTTSEKDAVQREIERMDMRLSATGDVQPLPPALPPERKTPTTPAIPATNPASPTADMATPAATVSDVIVALEEKSDLTAEERFELDVLKALKASRDRATLIRHLYPDMAAGYAPTWHVVVAALGTCAAGNADETLARLREAEANLVSKSSVRVESATFCTDPIGGGAAIEGIGMYHPRKSTTFKRGEKALLYLEVADFETRKRGDLYEYRLSREASLLDLAGREAHKFKKVGDTFKVRTPVDRTFWPMMFRMPGAREIYAGDYILRLTVTDELKKQFAEERVRITIR